MAERRYHEKDEKNEKEDEKHEEKSRQEKWRNDPLGALVWAGILIWAGLVLLLANTGLFVRFERLNLWDVIFTGAGLILLFEVLVRLAVPEYRRPLTGTLIVSMVFLAIGLGGLFGWNIIWPLVLVAIGLAILLGGVLRL